MAPKEQKKKMNQLDNVLSYQANKFISATREKQEPIVVFVKHQVFDVSLLFSETIELNWNIQIFLLEFSFTRLNSI